MPDTAEQHLKHPCFWVPGSDTIIDTAELRDDVWRSTIQNEDRLCLINADFGLFLRQMRFLPQKSLLIRVLRLPAS